jgi:hypothetical protein
MHAKGYIPIRIAMPKIIPRAIAAFSLELRNDEDDASPGLLLDFADRMGGMDVAIEDVVAALEKAATEDEAHSGSLDSPNLVEYWNWPVTLSINCNSYFASEVTINEPDGVHTKDPEFAMPIASVESVRESSGKPYEKHQVDITGCPGLPLN